MCQNVVFLRKSLLNENQMPKRFSESLWSQRSWFFKENGAIRTGLDNLTSPAQHVHKKTWFLYTAKTTSHLLICEVVCNRLCVPIAKQCLKRNS